MPENRKQPSAVEAAGNSAAVAAERGKSASEASPPSEPGRDALAGGPPALCDATPHQDAECAPVVSAPRILVILRAGRNSIHRSWIWTLHGLVDVAISTYDDSDYSTDGARFVHHSPGGKLSGVKDFLDAQPSVIEEYEYFWLFEDDLTLPFASLRMVLDLLGRFPFALSAPALSHESIMGWPINMTNSRFLFRGTDFVEQMMPIMSRDFLRAALPAFKDNYSGYGQEWLWQKFLKERQTFAVIFDCAPMTHTRPYEFGSLRKNRPSDLPDPVTEMRVFLKNHGLVRAWPRNYFGVTSDQPPRLLVQDAFLREALGGYEALRALPTDIFQQCIDTLSNAARPTTPYHELRKMPDFCMIEDSLQTGVDIMPPPPSATLALSTAAKLAPHHQTAAALRTGAAGVLKL